MSNKYEGAVLDDNPVPSMQPKVSITHDAEEFQLFMGDPPTDSPSKDDELLNINHKLADKCMHEHIANIRYDASTLDKRFITHYDIYEAYMKKVDKEHVGHMNHALMQLNKHLLSLKKRRSMHVHITRMLKLMKGQSIASYPSTVKRVNTELIQNMDMRYLHEVVLRAMEDMDISTEFAQALEIQDVVKLNNNLGTIVHFYLRKLVYNAKPFVGNRRYEHDDPYSIGSFSCVMHIKDAPFLYRYPSGSRPVDDQGFITDTWVLPHANNVLSFSYDPVNQVSPAGASWDIVYAHPNISDRLVLCPDKSRGMEHMHDETINKTWDTIADMFCIDSFNKQPVINVKRMLEDKHRICTTRIPSLSYKLRDDISFMLHSASPFVILNEISNVFKSLTMRSTNTPYTDYASYFRRETPPSDDDCDDDDDRRYKYFRLYNHDCNFMNVNTLFSDVYRLSCNMKKSMSPSSLCDRESIINMYMQTNIELYMDAWLRYHTSVHRIESSKKIMIDVSNYVRGMEDKICRQDSTRSMRDVTRGGHNG